MDIERDPSVPIELRGVLSGILAHARETIAAHVTVLSETAVRLRALADDLADDDPGFIRPRADVRRKLADTQRALESYRSGRRYEEFVKEVVPYVERYKQLQIEEHRRRLQEAKDSAVAETRYLPAPPPPSSPTHDASMAASREPGLHGYGTLSGMTTEATHNYAMDVAREAKFSFGAETRPVDLIDFDMCPAHRVAMQYNVSLQQLVCPTPGCTHWKRFADMTSSALAYGEEVEFCKYMYKPVTHLDDTMRYAEAREAHVVPIENLEALMVKLRKRRVKPEDITIAMIRDLCTDTPGCHVQHTVQCYSRLTGIQPRRFLPFMKQQIRMMFNAQEAPFRRHALDRVNNLSFPFTVYKYCELLGYWEMLEPLRLLRTNPNKGLHDHIYASVCASEELDWQFIPTLQGRE